LITDCAATCPRLNTAPGQTAGAGVSLAAAPKPTIPEPQLPQPTGYIHQAAEALEQGSSALLTEKSIGDLMTPLRSARAGATGDLRCLAVVAGLALPRFLKALSQLAKIREG